MAKLTTDEKRRLLNAMLGERPPAMGIGGLSGTGKSTTINASFSTKLPVSHTRACTKEFWKLQLSVEARQGDLKGEVLRLGVYDAPGLGEDLSADAGYLDMYKQCLPECDVILWLLSARNRALALDQKYLQELRPFTSNMMFGLSQVDLVAPMDWSQGLPIPSVEQEQNIREIISDRQARLAPVLGYSPTIIPFSAAKGYNMEVLFTSMLRAAPKGRKWLFELIKGYRLEDWIPESVSTRRQAAAAETKKPERLSLREEAGQLLGRIRRAIAIRFKTDSEVEIANQLSELLGRPNLDHKTLTLEELKEIEARLAREQLQRAEKSEEGI